jgi:hypothetical protein
MRLDTEGPESEEWLDKINKNFIQAYKRQLHTDRGPLGSIDKMMLQVK